MNIESNSQLEERIVSLSSQIKLVDYIQNYMSVSNDEMIPSNLTLNDESTIDNSLLYNKLLLERNRIIENSSQLNPTVINLEAQLKTTTRLFGF